MYRILIALVILVVPCLAQRGIDLEPVFKMPIEGTPFSARYQSTRSWVTPGAAPIKETKSGELFRDSKGRLRENTDQDGFVRIEDPVANVDCWVWGDLYIDDLSSALHGPFAGDGHRLCFTLPFPELPAHGKRNGRRTMDGLDCDGFVIEDRDSIPGGYRSEYWVSRDIYRIVFEKITARNTEQTYRLFDVHQVEPPASAFVIPTK
jgi:hypothetical protein